MRTERAVLAGILLLAAALRLYALSWGLPDVHHPDELYILNRAMAFAKGDLSPHNFLYPTLYFYALFVWEGLFFAAGRLMGLYTTIGGFEREFFRDPSHAVLAGRALTSLFGIATVWAVYRWGTVLYDRWTGLVAALLLAVAPFAVRDAHYIKHDIPVTLFIVLCQLAVARIVVDPVAGARRRPWIWAGAFAGLALSTQYDAAPVLVSIVAAAILQGQRTRQWRLAAALLACAAGASIVAFAVTSPFFLIEWRVVVRDMVAVSRIDMGRAVTGSGAFGTLGPYLRMIATDAMGSVVAAVSVMGLGFALYNDWRRAAVVASFLLAFLLFLSNTVPMSRYVNPILPSLALVAAYAIRVIGRTRPRLMLAMALLVGAEGLVASVRADRFYAAADTRTEAREFVERTAQPGSGVLVQPHSVQLRASYASLVEALRAHLGSEAAASVKFQKELTAAAATPVSYRLFYLGKITDNGLDPDKVYVSPGEFSEAAGLAPLRARQVAYVALNQYNTANSAFGSLEAALSREAHLLATFSPYRAGIGADQRAAAPPFFHNTADRIDPALERPGPVIEVWQVH